MKTKVIALFISLTWMAGGSSARASEGPSPRKIEGGVGSAAAILFEALRENRRLEKNGVKVVLTETTSTGIEEITKVSTATRREDQVRCERKKVSTRKPRDNFDVLSHAGRPENYDRQISYRCLFWLSSSKIISPGGVDQLAPVLFGSLTMFKGDDPEAAIPINVEYDGNVMTATLLTDVGGQPIFSCGGDIGTANAPFSCDFSRLP